MAPKFFSAFPFLKSGENRSVIYDQVPLFNFIDLLIVDEAGQVSPEVGTATFALAKQAIVVGDVKQIEPVWNITGKVDIGNLRREGLIKGNDGPIYSEIFDKGFLASSGNIMKMAQNASDFKESDLNEKGVLLVEHMRCYDEIISYCNDLAYNGQLKPLRGKAGSDILFPPMYCIHVEGNSTQTNASRSNSAEAQAIIDWLCVNRRKIAEKYKKTVEDCVGIITPFVGQKNALKDSLKHAGFDVNKIKLGTVHALQGGERPIVLFSMVYGKGDTGVMFFDRDNKPNMLNVAVSRAKDNFIVFANTNILNKNATTPSGILANHLVYHTSERDCKIV
jgi:superfamily I DNA and/or RNA helicase